MYTADKQKRTIFFFFTQCFNITCDGEKLFTYLLTKIEREVHRGDKRFIHQLKFLFYGNVFFTPVSPCVNLFGKNLGYFERYFTKTFYRSSKKVFERKSFFVYLRIIGETERLEGKNLISYFVPSAKSRPRNTSVISILAST